MDIRRFLTTMNDLDFSDEELGWVVLKIAKESGYTPEEIIFYASERAQSRQVELETIIRHWHIYGNLP